MRERLQKIISSIGVTSRRKAEELIAEGRVTVNGSIVQPGAKADRDKDYIKIDGKLINVRQKHQPLYIKFYKPKGVITSLYDPEGRSTIKDFIHSIKYRIFPVGRLDYNSEGLLLLTNDGNFANRVLHPSKKIPKTYQVKVKGLIDNRSLNKLKKGIFLEDAKTTSAEVKKLNTLKAENNSWIEITIYEGRNRQIRRMLQRVDYPVIKLKRTAIDGIMIGNLRPGEWRHITRQELNRISIN